MPNFYYFYGVRNQNGRKWVVSVQSDAEANEILRRGPVALDGFPARAPTFNPEAVALAAGAQEVYVHPTELVGVGEELPSGSLYFVHDRGYAMPPLGPAGYPAYTRPGS